MLKFRESIISLCFSRRAFVASFPASANSSSRLVSNGCQESVLAVSKRGAAMAGACGIEAPITAFWMSVKRLLIFRMTLTNRASDCATGSWSSVCENIFNYILVTSWLGALTSTSSMDFLCAPKASRMELCTALRCTLSPNRFSKNNDAIVGRRSMMTW